MDNNNKQIFCEKLNNLFDATTKAPMIHECTMHIESKEGDFIWSKEYGGRTLDSIMNIASITKLFTTTCIINLMEQGKLSLNDKLGKYTHLQKERLFGRINGWKSFVPKHWVSRCLCC